LIVYPVFQREIYRIILSLCNTNILKALCKPKQYTYARISSAGEKLSELVKGDCHYAIGVVESLFYTITMMDIYINV
jgi:hypothetical protein